MNLKQNIEQVNDCSIVNSFPLLLSIVIFSAITPVSFASDVSNLSACKEIKDDAQRLKCYDDLAGKESDTASAIAKANAAKESDRASTDGSFLDRQWGGDNNFKLQSYRPTYFLVQYMSSPNEAPFSTQNGFSSNDYGGDLEHWETKIQLSGKTKMGAVGGGNIWLAYTQQSYWQAFNALLSRPFRETDYEPEIIYSHEVDMSALPSLRYYALGAVHQSNGQDDPFSRSWNRLYARFDFDLGGDSILMVRPWWRIPEQKSDDNNPDIEHYLGYGDVVFVRKLSADSYLSILMRNNLETRDNRGAMEVNLSFPGIGPLHWHLQFFSGYGESLIDYNHRQNTIGMGFDLINWP